MPDQSVDKNVAGFKQVETQAQATPVEAKAPEAPKETPSAESPNLDSLSASEIKALYEKARAEKEAKPEVPVADNSKKDEKTEVINEVKKEGLQEEVVSKPVVTEELKSVLGSVLEDKLKELGIEKKEVQSQAEKFFGFESQEALDKAYSEDMYGTTSKIFEKVADKVVSEKFKKYEEIVEEKLIASHNIEVRDFAPELKDDNSLLAKEFKNFLTNPANKKQINEWADTKGVNPLIEVVKKVRAEKFPDYLAAAKADGIKEGEERSAKAAKAFVEGGGKVVADDAMTMEKFNALPAEEMKKYLTRK